MFLFLQLGFHICRVLGACLMWESVELGLGRSRPELLSPEVWGDSLWILKRLVSAFARDSRPSAARRKAITGSLPPFFALANVPSIFLPLRHGVSDMRREGGLRGAGLSRRRRQGPFSSWRRGARAGSC